MGGPWACVWSFGALGFRGPSGLSMFRASGLVFGLGISGICVCFCRVSGFRG